MRTDLVGVGIVASLFALAACGDATTGGGGAGATPGTTPTSSTPTQPSCDANGAFVKLTLTGPQGRAFEWGAGKFTECHGGQVPTNTDAGTVPAASLQFNFAKNAPGGTFYVTLTTQGDVALGKNLPAKVNLSITDPKVDVSWKDCVAEITEVKEIGRFDNGQGPAYGIWDAYAGTAQCNTPAKALLSSAEYTLPKSEFRGIQYRLVTR